MKKFYALLLCCVILSTGGSSQIVTFNYTGELDSIQIPNCVDSILISAWGAQGEDALAGGVGGQGAFASGKLNVTPGDWVYVQVGGQNGYNGGGIGGTNGYTDFSGTVHGGNGGAGGGASDVRFGGNSLNERIIVAGGGGGGGHEGVWPGCQPATPAGDGGEGSGINGTAGTSTACSCASSGGSGGTTATIGAGGIGGGYSGGVCGGGYDGAGANGTLGQGGDGNANFYNGTGGGGGGGGGYYGGGAGGNGWDTTPGGGGGGGSSYTGTLNNPMITAGIRNGNGQVIITFIQSTPIMTTAVGTSGITLTAIQTGVSYQWLNCSTGNSIIAGATNQSYTPTANGTYAVQLNNGNGCVDTSSCYAISQVGLEQMTPMDVVVFPNPVSDKVQVRLPETNQQIKAVLFDMSGAIVFESIETNSSFELDLSAVPAGSYLLQLIGNDKFISNTSLVKK